MPFIEKQNGNLVMQGPEADTTDEGMSKFHQAIAHYNKALLGIKILIDSQKMGTKQCSRMF